jgi:hypothetical protein
MDHQCRPLNLHKNICPSIIKTWRHAFLASENNYKVMQDVKEKNKLNSRKGERTNLHLILRKKKRKVKYILPH